MAMPKSQINREREVGKEHFGFSLKPMLDENRNAGLRCTNKQQSGLQDQQPPVQDVEIMPEGLQRERKHPLDTKVGRGEDATQAPKNPKSTGGRTND